MSNLTQIVFSIGIYCVGYVAGGSIMYNKYNPIRIEARDINKDGHMDYIIHNKRGVSPKILVGQPDGTQVELSEYLKMQTKKLRNSIESKVKVDK